QVGQLRALASGGPRRLVPPTRRKGDAGRGPRRYRGLGMMVSLSTPEGRGAIMCRSSRKRGRQRLLQQLVKPASLRGLRFSLYGFAAGFPESAGADMASGALGGAGPTRSTTTC